MWPWHMAFEARLELSPTFCIVFLNGIEWWSEWAGEGGGS